MIKSLSPYYIYTPWVSPLTGAVATSYTIKLYIWKGAKDTPPVTANYEITKKNQTGATSGDDKINIARLISSFIDFNYVPPAVVIPFLSDGQNQVWCKKTIIYTTGSGADTGVEQLPTTNLVTKGYGYGMDGENPQLPTDGILLEGNSYKINSGGLFCVPILAPETGFNSLDVLSYPSFNLNYSVNINGTIESDEMVQNLHVNTDAILTDTSIEVTYGGRTIFLYITNECRYTPIEITFQNKSGAAQILTFFKASTQSMDVKNEQYERGDGAQPKDTYHQYVKYNNQGNSKFNANSGFVDEDNNEAFKQLLLSERVWANLDGVITPVNVSSKAIEYKTRQKDRLINYNIEFTMAFNEINNV